jgi:hypothetical protein
VVTLAVVLAGASCCSLALAQAGCVNPSPLPSGYAAPCPVFSVSPASVSQTSALSITATPQAGTDYIYTTADYAQGSAWLPVQLSGNNAAPSYSSGPATGSLTPSILSTLHTGTNYIVLWDWLWDATAQCYKGPGLNQCNTGTWRVQTFNLTQSSSGAAVSLSPTSLTFPSTQVGATSAVQYATLTDTGNAALIFSSGFTFSGDFGFGGAGTCAVVISYAPGASCTAGIGFAPTAVGTLVGTLTINDNAANTPQIVTLTGTGVLTSPTPTPSTSPIGCTNCNNYYVSSTGSGTTCTQVSPCALSQALNSFSLGSGGAVIHVANGTYAAGIIISRGGSSPSCV